MEKRKCAFLTMDSLDGFFSDDNSAIPELEKSGWEIEQVSWRSTTTDWRQFDIVIIRTTWDYQKAPKEFLAVLASIDQQSQLRNRLSLVRWNMSKTYLRDLQAKGIAIVPTLWFNAGASINPQEAGKLLDSRKLIIKPVVSANADYTYLLNLKDWERVRVEVENPFATRDFMIQAFMPAVVAEGEYSLFYFGGHYSHAILKSPQKGDFRVQEEHGGIIHAVRPEAELKQCGDKIIAVLPEIPLYARVDLVRVAAGQFSLMELELIEPSLYFDFDTGAAARFARAVDQEYSGITS